MSQFDRRSYIVRRPDISVSAVTATVPINVAAGVTYSINIYAPANSLCYLDTLYVEIPKPVGAASGTQELTVRLGGAKVVWGTYLYNKDVIFQYGHFYQSSSSLPADIAAILALLKDLEYTATVPVTLYYFNNTDVANACNLYYIFKNRKQVI